MSGFPDGIVSYQKLQFGYIVEGLGMENIAIFTVVALFLSLYGWQWCFFSQNVGLKMACLCTFVSVEISHCPLSLMVAMVLF
jgi:hypothetical protein